MKKPRLLALLGLAICFVSAVTFSPPLLAQSTYGSIAGSVADSSGAAIADAQVTLTNLGTAEKRAQTTGGDGLYSFVNLFPGRYKIEVEKTGFKRFTRPEVIVEVNQTSHIDVTLQVGDVTQTVEVTAETPLLQSETSSLGQVVERRATNELPLNGRNIFNLTAIAPSVVPQGNNYGTPVGKNPFDFANFQVGGSFANQSAEYLDGQPLNIGYINLPLILPTQDSVGEFKVQYNNLGPDWGKFSGGVINLSTKSGTNEWHGSAYEFLRNKVLNANQFFANKAGIARSPFTQNQFGATLGGAPLKEKLFAFFSWESFRLRQGTVFTTTVPTLAERGGNFADLCKSGFTATDPGGSPIPICADTAQVSDPANPGKTKTVFVHQLYDPLSIKGTNPQRTPFAGNVIPPALLNVSTNPAFVTPQFLLTLIPNPTNSATVNNFVKATGLGGDSDEYVPRVDYNISSKSHIFGRYSYWKLADLPRDPFGTGLCQDRCTETYHTHALAIGYNYSLTPTTTVDVNVSASRFRYLRVPVNAGFDVTKQGFPAAYNGAVPDIERTPLTPCFGISDPTITCSQGQSAISDKDTQYNFSPRVTMIRGRHTIAAGAQFELSYDNYLQTNTGGGLISFNGFWTQDKAAGAGTPGTGVDFADFLLGYGLGIGSPLGNQTSGAVNISGPVAGKQFYRAVYAGDTWKVSNKLTLNLGLRYDLQGPWSERFDRLTYFDPSVPNQTVAGCGGSQGSTCAGDLFLVKTGVNGGRNNLPLDTKNIMPRLGLAYSLNQKTVIRAGYGIFFIPNFVSFGVNPYIDPVSSSTNPFFASNNSGLTPASTLHDSNCTFTPGVPRGSLNCATAGPFGATLVVPPGRNPKPSVSGYALGLQNFSATGYTVQKNGSVQQWNLGVQRELPAGFFADVAYAGAHGVHLPQFNTNINQIPDGLIAAAAVQAAQGQTPTIAQVVPSATYPFIPNLSGSLAPGNLVRGQLNRPFPQYTGLNLNGQGCCGSNYHSLQATVVRRFRGGGTMLVAYTNAKLLATTDSLTSWLEGGGTGGVGQVQDWNNLKAERSLASQDVSERLVISYVLDLPFGRGKTFLNDVSGVSDKLVSGWGIDGVTIFQRGFPLKISYGGSTPLSSLGLGIGTLRPNAVPGCNKGRPAGASQLSQWFNTACFTAPPDWGFGNESRVDATLRQKGVNNFDFSIFKRTTFGPSERMNVEFRTEFFNIFNHPQFAAPNTTLVSPNFGVVTSTLGNPRLVQFALKFAF